MSINSVKKQLVRKMRDKSYRDAFVAEQIFSRLPLKIRRLREKRFPSQKELGDRIGVAQAWISRLEDPNYGKLTISTLLKVASAFDVGLHVDFVPFSQVLNNAIHLTDSSFEVESFDDDLALQEIPSVEPRIIATSIPTYETLCAEVFGGENAAMEDVVTLRNNQVTSAFIAFTVPAVSPQQYSTIPN